ncbi:hypothetical protein WICMUC_003107 [Wickerhamomyces mucosus]|uniref:Cytochrome b-c1 complex subunit 10 n=1 Tax=Wickerhamomyces mucosus TaxID=1378264 RepID=A0A9P8TDU5_9ASCO|nr:hypothetical protein WICMUC_003107 [Wickerhamomyces mucosus]
MVSYITRPVTKAIPHFGKLNLENLIAYTPNLVFWGGASTFGLFVFAEGVPVFQDTFFKKIPFFGEHWISNPDPQDLPQ